MDSTPIDVASNGQLTSPVRHPLSPVARRLGLVILLGTLLGPAAEAQTLVPLEPALDARAWPARPGLTAVAETVAAEPARPVGAVPPSIRRPRSLVPLYLSYGALQVLDVVATERALAAGATEANPLLQGVAGHTGATLAIKAGTTAATVFLVERLWRKSRPAAVVLMLTLNAGYAAVVAHNYRQVP